MTTMKQRRALSMYRRSGSQVPHEAIDGRVQRHAQGWRDQQPDPDWHEAPGTIIRAMASIGAVAAVLGAVVALGLWVSP